MFCLQKHLGIPALYEQNINKHENRKKHLVLERNIKKSICIIFMQVGPKPNLPYHSTFRPGFTDRAYTKPGLGHSSIRTFK